MNSLGTDGAGFSGKFGSGKRYPEDWLCTKLERLTGFVLYMLLEERPRSILDANMLKSLTEPRSGENI